jgi:hypothetical protein
MNPFQKEIKKYQNMSKQELLLEIGVLLYKLYNFKTTVTHLAIKYSIRLITSELSKRL